jgi:hypothetical protein
MSRVKTKPNEALRISPRPSNHRPHPFPPRRRRPRREPQRCGPPNQPDPHSFLTRTRNDLIPPLSRPPKHLPRLPPSPRRLHLRARLRGQVRHAPRRAPLHPAQLASLPIRSANPDPDPTKPGAKPYILRTATKEITLRHLLLHASGIGSGSDPLIEAWKRDQPAKPPGESKIVDLFSYPLLFEPGDGYDYGASIYWTDLFLSRLTKLPYGGANEEFVLDRSI